MPIYKVLGTKIPVAQYAALERYLKRKGITRSEFVRRFVSTPLAEVVNGRDPLGERQPVESVESNHPHA